MDAGQLILRLVVDQNSPDNNIRKNAELEFNRVVHQDPTVALLSLIQLAVNGDNAVDLRQSCLLHLKRMVPKYWSIGFQSFVGPPIGQDVKQMIRGELMSISTTSVNSKLRSSSSYVIVQIASADYPDEWPDLIQQLFNCITKYDDENAMIGGLVVLNDLFDDLITEEQFWEGGVGYHLITYINQILGQPGLNLDIKTNCINFYHSILNTLQSPEAFASPERKTSVQQHISQSIVLFMNLLEQSVNSSDINTRSASSTDLKFRTSIYKILNAFLGTYYKLFSKELLQSMSAIIMKDFDHATRVAESKEITINASDEAFDAERLISNLIIELLSTLQTSQLHSPLSIITTQFETFVKNLIQNTILPQEKIEEYHADFNAYITDISEYSVDSTIRDAISNFLSELNDTDTIHIFNYANLVISSPSDQWQVNEANLYILGSLFINEDSDIISQNISFNEFLTNISKFVNSTTSLVTARVFLVLHRFYEKFSEQISVNTFGIKSFVDMIEFAAQDIQDDEFNLVRASALISANFYKNILDFNLIVPSKKQEVQYALFTICLRLLDECEEDGLSALLEAIMVGLNIDSAEAFKLVLGNGVTVVDLIYKISFKDAANVQLTIDASECLEQLLANVSVEDYLNTCEKSLPFIFNILQSPPKRSAEDDFSPELNLALELLSVTIQCSPSSENGFPQQIFNYTFPLVRDLLLSSSDPQILQTGGEAFNNLVEKASQHFLNYVDPKTNESGTTQLLSVTSKFLSTELSDRAARNCGIIVCSLINKFQPYLNHDFISQLLEATVRRLIICKDTVTTENLVMVFCDLVLASPQDMVNFLGDAIKIESGGKVQTGLELILPIWFESFEVTRGYEKIKKNALALGKIFSLGDPRVESLEVNGDIIPYDGDLIITRSMSRSMPEKYTRISASQKILKLLIGELNFQCQQPDENDYLPDNVEGDDGDTGEWEDMDDIGVPNYEKLKSYVDSDASDDEHDDQKGDEDLKNILVQFFKECTSKNLGNFEKYYSLLDDDEKKIITEHVVF